MKKLIKDFPITTIIEETNRNTYTKDEVNALISAAIERAIDEAKRLMKSQWQSIIVMQLSSV